MAFRRTSTHYGQSPHPETPYQKAGQVWEFAAGLRSAKQSIRGMDCRRRTPRQRRIGSLFNRTLKEA